MGRAEVSRANKALIICKAIAARTKDKYEITLASQTNLLQTSWLSMGVYAFNKAIGNGLPLGRITEIYGPWSSGKTVLILKALGKAQKKGYIPVLYDSEGSLEEKFAKSHGVNLDALLYTQPRSLEHTFQSMLSIIRYVEVKHPGTRIIFALDSLAAFPAEEEIIEVKETSKKKKKTIVDKRTMGMRRANIISSFLKRMTTRLSKGKHMFLFTNQMRDNTHMFSFSDPDVTVGGQAVKFHASVRIRMARLKQVRKGTKVLGHHGRLTIKKSKVGVPFKQVNFFLSLDGQISLYSGYLDFLEREGTVSKVRRKSKDNPQRYRYKNEEGKSFLFCQSSFRAFIKKHRELR